MAGRVSFGHPVERIYIFQPACNASDHSLSFSGDPRNPNHQENHELNPPQKLWAPKPTILEMFMVK